MILRMFSYIHCVHSVYISQTPPVFCTLLCCMPSLCTLNIPLIIFMVCKCSSLAWASDTLLKIPFLPSDVPRLEIDNYQSSCCCCPLWADVLFVPVSRKPVVFVCYCSLFIILFSASITRPSPTAAWHICLCYTCLICKAKKKSRKRGRQDAWDTDDWELRPPLVENHSDERVYVDISYWGQLHSSLLLSSTPPILPPLACHVLFVFSSKQNPTRLCRCWEDSLAQLEQRAASCLQCVTPPSLLLFLPPSSIYNFPLSYICLTQLSRELFVTKKAFTLDFCLLLIIFDRTTQYQNAFVFPVGYFDEYKKGNLIIQIFFFLCSA